MAYIPIENLLNKTDSVYKLVILAAKRAVELNQGAGRLIEVGPGVKLSSIALREISEGKVALKLEAIKEPKKGKK
jgi:DNA-directed RNA polymerase omega subunit